MVRVENQQIKEGSNNWITSRRWTPRPRKPTSRTAKDLVVSVRGEKHRQRHPLALGFSSVESISWFYRLKQGNFDLFNPPNIHRKPVKKFADQKPLSAPCSRITKCPLSNRGFWGNNWLSGLSLSYLKVDYNSLGNARTETFDGGTL